MFGLARFFVFCVSVMVKLAVPLLCTFVCILSEKAVPEMTYTVSVGTLNPTHSLTLVFVCHTSASPAEQYTEYKVCRYWAS